MLAIRKLIIGTVLVDVYQDHVDTWFPDGNASHFWPPVCDRAFQDTAHKMGYLNAMQYGLEHDLTHSWLAVNLGRSHSLVVWADAHGVPQVPKQLYDDEEHLVNRMQCYLNTGIDDQDYRVLRYTFGNRLPHLGSELWLFLRGNAGIS